MGGGDIRGLAFVDPAGVRWLARYVRAANGWGVVAMQQEGEVLAEARWIQWWSCVATARRHARAVAALAWAVAARITKPISEITQAAVAVANGKWDVPVTVDRHDEIGTLETAFNAMTSKLQEGYRENRSDRGAADRRTSP
jgi:HAMP domain-containing protein